MQTEEWIAIGAVVLIGGYVALRGINQNYKEQAHAQNLTDALRQNFLDDARRNIALRQRASQQASGVKNTTQSMAGFADKPSWSDEYHAATWREPTLYPDEARDQVDTVDFQGW